MSKETHREASFSSVSLYTQEVRSFNVALGPQRPQALLGTGSQGRPPRLSHSSWAQWRRGSVAQSSGRVSGAKQWESQWRKAVGESVAQSSGRVSGAEQEHSFSRKSKLNTIERGHETDGCPLRPPWGFSGVKFCCKSPSDETINRGPPCVYARR